jgi:hypothetical protein
MKRLLRRAFDVEIQSYGWDLRLWPIGRLYFKRKGTTSGVERTVGLYRMAQWEYSIMWWVAG